MVTVADITSMSSLTSFKESVAVRTMHCQHEVCGKQLTPPNLVWKGK